MLAASFHPWSLELDVEWIIALVLFAAWYLWAASVMGAALRMMSVAPDAKGSDTDSSVLRTAQTRSIPKSVSDPIYSLPAERDPS